MKYAIAPVLALGLLLGSTASGGFAEAKSRWTYQQCVEKCRQTIPPGVTVEMCKNKHNCAQYPRK